MKKIIIIFCFIFLITGCKKNLIIELDSNPTTGYNWNYEVSNDIVDIDESYKTNCKGNISGCGGKNIYNIKPKKDGTTTIKFYYRRNFENKEPLYTAIYDIKIDKNLNIKEKHYGNYFEKGKE